MRIVEIATRKNGGHRNQSGDFATVPKGWAVIPDDMETPNFPFGDIQTEDKNGVMTVTKWTAREIPISNEETPVSEMEQLRADVDFIAVMTGVEL